MSHRLTRAQHRAAAAALGQTQRTDQSLGGEREREGFLDLKRLYLICDQPADIKDPVPRRANHTALNAAQS